MKRIRLSVDLKAIFFTSEDGPIPSWEYEAFERGDCIEVSDELHDELVDLYDAYNAYLRLAREILTSHAEVAEDRRRLDKPRRPKRRPNP